MEVEHEPWIERVMTEEEVARGYSLLADDPDYAVILSKPVHAERLRRLFRDDEDE